MLNILSIDWDYFINANAEERANKFPDIPNENYPQFLQDTIWVTRYGNEPALSDISYNPVIHDLAKNFTNIPRIIVCDSHKWIYSHINQLQMKQRKSDHKINLLNIDFHSDFRQSDKELDCGNWLNFVMKKYKGRYRWLGWNDSYIEKLPKQLQVCTDLSTLMSDIKYTKWDLLFICRSSMWSPPHLDSAFTDIFYPLFHNCPYGIAEHNIWQSRFTDEMKKNIETMRTAISQIYLKNKTKKEAV